MVIPCFLTTENIGWRFDIFTSLFKVQLNTAFFMIRSRFRERLKPFERPCNNPCYLSQTEEFVAKNPLDI